MVFVLLIVVFVSSVLSALCNCSTMEMLVLLFNSVVVYNVVRRLSTCMSIYCPLMFCEDYYI